MESKTIKLRTLPIFLKSLSEAIDLFSGGDENKQSAVELECFLIKDKDEKGKEYHMLLPNLTKAIREVKTNNTSIAKPNHWILNTISMKNEGGKK